MYFICSGALETVRSHPFFHTEILPGSVAVVAGPGCPLCHRSHLQAGQDHGPRSLKVKTTFMTGVADRYPADAIRIRLSILMTIWIRICFLP